MTDRLKVGVIGAGVIAQVMHLNYLRELDDHFEITAICDVAEDTAAANAVAFGVAGVFTDWRELIEQPLDTVLVLTSGSHAAIAIAAAQAGKHVFVEKPMCFSVAEGKAMRAAAERAGVTLMVGYPKRYDPAYARFRDQAAGVRAPRMLRVTTLESPLRPYVEHYRLTPPGSLSDTVAQQLAADTAAAITAAIGESTEFLRRTYHLLLLDTLVHEINAVRGLLGEPDRLEYVDLTDTSLTVYLKFARMPVAIHWLDLPGIASYLMEFALYGPDQRVTLRFPSPFLRSAPTLLEIEGGEIGTARSWRTEELTSYDSPFRRELEEFHRCITTGVRPITDATDGLHDLALCEAIIRSFASGSAIDNPTRFE